MLMPLHLLIFEESMRLCGGEVADRLGRKMVAFIGWDLWY